VTYQNRIGVQSEARKYPEVFPCTQYYKQCFKDLILAEHDDQRNVTHVKIAMAKHLIRGRLSVLGTKSGHIDSLVHFACFSVRNHIHK
jgi:hypothetical protein